MQTTRTQHQGRRHRQAETVRANEIQACIQLTSALVHEGRVDKAWATLAPITLRYPNDAAILALHGKVLLKLGRPEPAIGALMLALERQPGNAETLSDLVLAHLELGQSIQSLPYAIEAFRIVQDGARAVNLSCILIDLGAYAEALGFADHALSLRADHFEAMGNRALALEGLRRYEEAIDAGRNSVGLAPGNAALRHNLAVIELAAGHLTAEVWDHYESRLELKAHQLPWSAKLVRWEGEDIRGRTIVLHAEQGLGDTLQFVRYAPLVAARGARVILVVQRALFRLLRNAPGVHELVAVGDDLPPFDVYCPLMSLPRVFGTTLATIPPVIPYTAIKEVVVPEHHQSLPGLRVGLVWAGNRQFITDRLRSLDLTELGVLAGIEGVQFYGLQYGPVQAPPPGLKITNLMEDVGDFADTAALIAGLDLVIAADTAVAHLAATLGKPVWLLSRFRGCWRWLQGRADTPWYPTLRLYRQERPNEWHGALEQIRADLGALVAQTHPQPAWFGRPAPYSSLSR